MIASELLRAAAEVLRVDGWSRGAPARDAGGLGVPLFKADAKDGINPAATSFSLYGAIVKAQHAMRVNAGPEVWDLLFKRARERIPGGLNGKHPTSYFNDMPEQTAEGVIALLEDCATELEGGAQVDPPVVAPSPAVLEQMAEKVVEQPHIPVVVLGTPGSGSAGFDLTEIVRTSEPAPINVVNVAPVVHPTLRPLREEHPPLVAGEPSEAFKAMLNRVAPNPFGG